jgi:hypothetical protein
MRRRKQLEERAVDFVPVWAWRKGVPTAGVITASITTPTGREKSRVRFADGTSALILTDAAAASLEVLYCESMHVSRQAEQRYEELSTNYAKKANSESQRRKAMTEQWLVAKAQADRQYQVNEACIQIAEDSGTDD